jgi:tripartite-type tricarboxylate transporter receptor subunit TctC
VGLYPASSTPAEFAAFIRSEAARWEPVVKKSGLHFD